MRDALAGRPVADIDLATPLLPDAVTSGLGRLPASRWSRPALRMAPSPPWWTAAASRSPRCAAMSKPTAAMPSSPSPPIGEQDASRRDFTINAMSMARDGTVFDYFGGIGRSARRPGALRRRPGDPHRRGLSAHPPLLPLPRALRPRAARRRPRSAALQAGIPGLAQLSIERVWHELRRILAAPDPAEAVGLMDRLGIWAAVVPEATAVSRLAGLPADPVLRLAAMLTGDPLALALACD